MAGFPHDSTLQHWQFLILEGIFHFPKKSESFVMETHILSCTCLNYKLKILKKRCQEKWENAYLTLKNTRASRALRRALDPGRYMLTSLALRCTPSANLGKNLLAPPDQILDPHLRSLKYSYTAVEVFHIFTSVTSIQQLITSTQHTCSIFCSPYLHKPSYPAAKTQLQNSARILQAVQNYSFGAVEQFAWQRQRSTDITIAHCGCCKGYCRHTH